MSSTVAFASTPNEVSGLANATLDTSLTAPTNTTSLIVGGSSSTKVNELVLQAVGTTVAGVVNVFRDDGTTKHLYKQYLVTAVTSSTTALAWRTRDQFTDFIIKNGETMKFSQTIAGNQSMIKATATGADF